MNRLESGETPGGVKKRLPLVKGIKIIINIFIIALGLITFLIVVSLLNSKFKQQPPSFAGCKFYAVLGKSMEPAINMGNLVGVKSVNPDELKLGDVITFNNILQDGEPTTHRIVDIKNEGELSFVTKGDANNGNDSESTLYKDIIGEVYLNIPYVGRLLSFTKTKAGIITLIVVPSFFIGVTEFVKLLGYINESRKSKQKAKLDKFKK
jgi:signal peptidase I